MKRTSYYTQRHLWRTRAIEWVLYALAYAFRIVTRPFPVWGLSAVIAPVAARLTLLIPRFRSRIVDNLDLVWPDLPAEQRRRLSRVSVEEFTHLAVEYGHLERFLDGVEADVEGIEHLAAARASGRGAVIVTAHFGNWEVARKVALRAGYEIGIIYRAFNNRYLDRYAVALIGCAGLPVLHKGRQGMRALLDHVKKGGMAMILVDQRNSGAPFIDFLGVPAETVTVAATLAGRADAVLIPVRAERRTAERRFHVSFEAPVPPGPSEEMMAEINRRIGAWIEQTPEQWFWFHRRWRSTARSQA